MENEKFNYTLIVSQYYHSRHFFIVKHTEKFMDQAKAFARELIVYKRGKDCKHEMYLGDLEWNYATPETKPRYNINDSGDIYFINSIYANYLMHQAIKFREDTLRESRGYVKKAIVQDISEHHYYDDVKKIVEKHFEIV